MSKYQEELREYQALHAVAEAAEKLLTFSVLDRLCIDETIQDWETIGVRVADLRGLRAALVALDAAR